MKKSLLFALAVTAITFIIIPACKKGPDDPLISFRSRAARIEGNWNVTKYNLTETDTYTGSSGTSGTQTSMETITGNNILWISSNLAYAGTITTNTMNFTKDGNWTANEAYFVSTNYQGQTFSYNFSSSSNGTWKFNSAIDGYKDKESITITQLSETDVTTTTINGSSTNHTQTNTSAEVQIWHLLGLRDKKMEFELGENYTQTNTDNGTTVVTAILKGNLSGTFEK